ncbi:hypothetical protein Poly24_05490 [Rosistilla carotiformis]|uniref:LamG-like jellyroll fold domain-containing protein n=1 Tax=Rosistilla carotiformis TaxID=2528017 RepID=A0A518JMY4_9BACT|nr:LamG domain-containing protein [Rosistilla carotiformis]QDV66861.1 hypothetical protein Poly24_05490 [Rosistilla carotiformis]
MTSLPHRLVFRILFALIAAASLNASALLAQEAAVRWWAPYADASEPEVLGLWKFDGDGDAFTNDASSHQHKGTLRGAKQSAEGRFGGCLETAAGYPINDKSHSLHVAQSPVLSPSGAFTVEMWLRAKEGEEFPAKYAAVLLDMKYVPDNHTGFMFSLSPGRAAGTRSLHLEIGGGRESTHWYSVPFPMEAGIWRHVAFTYDGIGTAEFFVDGSTVGRSTNATAGPMAAAIRPLSIGDRIGSLYRGFPGFIDEVRITSGVREFQPFSFVPESERFVFQRMSESAFLTAQLINRTGESLSGAIVTATLPDGSTQRLNVPALGDGVSHRLKLKIDTALKPGEYFVELSATVPNWGGIDAGYQTTSRIPVVIVKRPLPDRMPVVMWGVGGTDGVIKEIPRLKQIGFTHCLGLRSEFQRIWDGGADALPDSAEDIREGRNMLNAALENDLQIVASLAPGRWLRTAAVGKSFRRIDRKGEHYDRDDISGLFPAVQEFAFNSGAAMGRAYGDHPAFSSALLHTEVRGETQVSFLPIEIEAYRKATGKEIPAEVTIKNGVQWQKLADFPKNRVVADDHPILQYLTWFWKTGDGWNELNTRLHEGLKQHTHDGFWSFYDPAVRAPSIAGSGGRADVLAHWTYSYPDPIRIGLCTDELFELARVNGHDQDVMKMTQLIWYRSQTAPKKNATDVAASPWVDQDPDADYISIAPMHLREAFWWKLSRPITGIMYHGWQSLVETESPGAYRYTNPNTQHELQRLIHDVVQPLGPTLMQIPDPPSDVVFLESFTSQMFARRGTYGWNRSWAADMYHILMYAQLQPRVLYEQSLLSGGLEGAKVLVMADCDVLTESVVRLIQEFQSNGGLVVGDAEVCPAIKPDLVIPRFARTKQADKDRTALQDAAKRLRTWLDPQYSRAVDSSNPDVVTRRRVFGSTDYVFAVNDHREFGTYVGGYGMVMEDGLPSETTLLIDRKAGHVYDLIAGREIDAESVNGSIAVPMQLGPCQGRLLMVTQRPIRELTITAPKESSPSQLITIDVAVTDGSQPVDAVVPVEVEIISPEGRRAEFSGFHAAKAGELSIRFDFADNDRIGVWEVRAKELASGTSATTYVRLTGPNE